MIVRLQTSEIKRRIMRPDFSDNKEEEIRPRDFWAAVSVAARKSKFHSAHAIPRHLEVLHAKFYDRATSNLRDSAETKKSGRVAPAAQRGRKSKFHSAHAHLHHLEVLHAKFHDRATSNFGD